jgi:hypothetical protein
VSVWVEWFRNRFVVCVCVLAVCVGCVGCAVDDDDMILMRVCVIVL